MHQPRSWLADIASDFIVYTYTTLRFLFYAAGNLLLVAGVLSFIDNNELVVRSIVDGSFLLLLAVSAPVLLSLGVAVGLVAAVAHTAYRHLALIGGMVDTFERLLLLMAIRLYLLGDTLAGSFDPHPLLRERWWYAADLHVLHLAGISRDKQLHTVE